MLEKIIAFLLEMKKTIYIWAGLKAAGSPQVNICFTVVLMV